MSFVLRGQNTNSPNNTLDVRVPYTLSECQSWCSERSACTGLVFRTTTHACYLKYGALLLETNYGQSKGYFTYEKVVGDMLETPASVQDDFRGDAFDNDDDFNREAKNIGWGDDFFNSKREQDDWKDKRQVDRHGDDFWGDDQQSDKEDERDIRNTDFPLRHHENQQ